MSSRSLPSPNARRVQLRSWLSPLAALSLLCLCLRADQPTIEVVPIEPPEPTGGAVVARSINNLDQVIGDDFIWLPEPAYGLPAGYNELKLPEDLYHSFWEIGDSGILAGQASNLDTGESYGATLANLDGIVSHQHFTLDTRDQSRIIAVNSKDQYLGSYATLKENGTPKKHHLAVQLEERFDIINPNFEYFGVLGTDINESGNVAGNFQNNYSPSARGFFWDGSVHILDGGSIEDLMHTEVSDMNDLNQIVGVHKHYPNGDIFSKYDLFLWLPEPAYGLPAGLNIINTYPDGFYHVPFINNLGQIIWRSGLWDRGAIYDLSDLLPESETRQMIGIYDFNNRGTALAQFYGENNQWEAALLKIETPPFQLEISVPEKRFDNDDIVPITLTVSSIDPNPVTVSFDTPPVVADKDGYLLFEPDYAIEPFILDADNPSKEIVVPTLALKRGIVELVSSAVVTNSDGVDTTLIDSLQVPISPMSIEVRITPEETVHNLTPDSKKTEAALAYEANRDEEAIWTDCIEISATIKNETDQTITNVEILGAENVLSMIASADLEEPGVPLEIVDLVSDSGVDAETGKPLPQSLEPGESLTIKWYVGVYDSPRPLNFKALASGGLGLHSARVQVEKEFKLIEKVLLEWGIRAKGGRTQYLSGNNAWAEGFIQNVSKDNGEEQDLVVMIYQLPKGNVGGGYMVESSRTPGANPKPEDDLDLYQFFTLPAEGDGSRIDLVSYFRSMPTYETSEGTVEYGVRLWIIDDEENLTNADDQALLTEEEGWSRSFEVTFNPQPPKEVEKDIDECLDAGLPPWLCGVSHGIYYELGPGLADMMAYGGNLAKDTKNLSLLMVSENCQAMIDLWNGIQGDPAALDAFVQEMYVQYETWVNLGVMAGEAGSKTPMAFVDFSQIAIDSFSQFMFSIQTGNAEKRQIIIGKFLGANPDLLIEPLVALRGWNSMRRAALEIAEGSADNYLVAAQRERAEQLARSARSRVDEAFAAGKDAAKVLKAGDKLTDEMLLRIYGIDRKQLKALQQVAEEHDIVLTFRSRNPLSLEWLKGTPPRARVKPQALKHKTVNEIDVEFLGYPSDAKATLSICEPPKSLQNLSDPDALKAAAEAYVKKLEEVHPKLKNDSVLRNEVYDRMITRAEEWEELVPKNKNTGQVVEEFEIEVSFDAGTNFTEKRPGKKTGVKDLRKVRQTPIESYTDKVTGETRKRFSLETTGPVLSEGAEAAVFKPITGDVDFLAILEPNGMMIHDPARRIRIYQALAAVIDMQHGESFTFFLQKVREKYLRCCVSGAPDTEAMVAIGPGARKDPRAAFFVDNLSVMKDGPNHKFLGPRNKLRDKYFRVIKKKGEPILIRRQDVSGEFILLDGYPMSHTISLQYKNYFLPKVYSQVLKDALRRFTLYLPIYIHRIINSEETESVDPERISLFSEPKPSVDEYVVTFSENGPVLQIDRTVSFSALRVWTKSDGWQAVTKAEAIALGAPGVADIAPSSSLPLGARSGESTFSILTMEEQETTGRYFEVGDLVAIDPGQAKQEFAVVSSTDPFSLTSALIFDHDEGSMIAFVEANAVDSDGDGLTDDEEEAHGTNPNLADTDGDGLSDSQELAYGTDPLDARSRFEFADVIPQSNSETAIAMWDAVKGKIYTLEVSYNLNTWNELLTVTAEADDALAIEFDWFHGEATESFFRLKLDD